MSKDTVGDLSTLDLATVDFTDKAWSWHYNAESKTGALTKTVQNDDLSFSTITYPLPACMVLIIDRIRNVALDELKRKLRALDQERSALLS